MTRKKKRRDNKSMRGPSPYRKAMKDDPRQFTNAISSLLRLYDFELLHWDETGPTINITGRTTR
ncbi:MAG: hypothetical protein ACI88C_000082 [Acidimicrobiales bacterium]|jgi:hypothetical protein